MRLAARHAWLTLVCLVALIGCTGEPARSAGPSGAPSLLPTFVATPPPSDSPTVAPTVAPTPPVSDGFAIMPGTLPPDFEGVVSCSGTIDATDPVAVVLLHGTAEESGPVELRDFADFEAPRTVCTFSGFPNGIRFVDARHLVGAPTDSSGLYFVVDVPEVRYHWIQLPAGSDEAFPTELAAISPKLDRLIWVSHEGGGLDAVHVSTVAADRSIANLRDTNEGRCGDPDDSSLGGFTPSGSLAYVLNRPLPADASLIVIDGSQVAYSLLAPKAGWSDREGPAKAIWSPGSDTLYYRTGDGVWRWRAGTGAKRFLPGVNWFGPTISSDGRVPRLQLG